MSALPSIRAALETQLATLSPAIDTVFENTPYVPVTGRPFQQVTLMPATPANLEMGAAWLEQGLLWVSLYYPKDAGPGTALARAEMIRAAFPYAASFTSGGVVVNITQTPEIGPARPGDTTFMIPVKIRWSARIGG